MGDEQIKGMAMSLRKKLKSLTLLADASKPCIYRAPIHMFKINEENYRPLTVSIGPIYYQDPPLKHMEELKLRHLKCLLEHGDNLYTLEEYLNVVREREEEIRACYAEKITLSSSEFIEMVLTDASFIVFLWFSFRFSLKNHPCKGKMVEVFSPVERDLFLEENQLPFFVLSSLYEFAFGNNHESYASFVDLTCGFIENRFIRGRYITSPLKISKAIREGETIKHLVDFARIYFILPTSPRRELASTTTSSSHTTQDLLDHYPLSATELSDAGVRFSTTTSKSLLDIRFTNGVLYIPRFTVQDTTQPLFHSLLLFEQCHYYFDSYFIDYMYFLFNLIKSPKDVRILVKNGIVDSWLTGEEEVANMFASSINRVPINLPNYYYSAIVKDLNAYATTPWHRWKVILKRDYFHHPWAITSVAYAIVLLILTLLQTIGGFKSDK